MAKKVVFLGTGGTIAGKADSADDNVGYKAGAVGIAHLLESAPGLSRALAGSSAESEQVMQINSKDMVFSDWVLLANRLQHHLGRPDVDAIVVTHGTDTLEETAYFLHRLMPALQTSGKPVVLTCAMRPASSSHADGPGNLEDATHVALSAQASGVVIVCAGKVHAALDLQKVHPYRVDPFDSGEAGPLGFVEEGRVRFVRSLISPLLPEVNLAAILAQPVPRVEIVISHSGAGAALVQDMLRALDASPDRLRGIVLAGTGNATAHQLLEAALLEAASRGVLVWRTTRCAYGQVVLATSGEAEAFEAIALPPVKARIEMQLQLMSRK